MWQLRGDGELVQVDEDGIAPTLIVDFMEAHPRRTERRDAEVVRSIDPTAGGFSYAAPDAAASRERAARRSRGRVRRWCVANKAVRLGTLTYRGEGQHAWPGVVRDLHNFRRRLRQVRPGLAILTAAELHPGGHGWHVHVALTDYVPQAVLASCWGQGFASVKLFRSRRSGSGPVSSRVVGRYVAKYLGKAQEGGERPAWAHAYEVTQGTQPSRLRLSGLSWGGVYAGLSALMGGEPGYRWDSSSAGGPQPWCGPPASFLSWQGPGG